MRLLFVILAHDRPEDAAGLARTLVAAASDARALIHFDARAPEAAFAALAAAVADAPRVGLVAKRVACRWGGFGLVEAPLNALAQAEAEAAARGWAPDYAILLSGACLPCRPVASLERFLAENAGREFIESEDESWVTGGWRAERWKLWHVFDHKTQNLAEHLSARLQKAARGAAALPQGAGAALRLAMVGADLAGGPGDPRRRPARPEAARLLPHRLDPRRDGVPDLRARAGAEGGDRRLRPHPLPVHQPRQAGGVPRRPRRLRPEPRALLRAQGLAGGDGAPRRLPRPRRRARRRRALRRRRRAAAALSAEDLGADPLPSAGRAVLPRPVHRPDRAGARRGRGPLRRGDRPARDGCPPGGAAAGAAVRRLRRALRPGADRPRPRPGRGRRPAPLRHRDPRRAPGALAGPGAGPRPGGRRGRGHPLVAGRRPRPAGGGDPRSGGARRHPAAALGRPGARPRGAGARQPRRRCGGAPPGCRSGCRRRRWRGRPSRPAAGRGRTSRSGWSAGQSPPPACGIPALPPARLSAPRLPRVGRARRAAAAARPGAALGRRPGPAARDRRRRELEAGLAACRFREAAWFPALAAALADAEPSRRRPTTRQPAAAAGPARELVR